MPEQVNPGRATGAFLRSVLGRTHRPVHRLGIASSFGLGASGVEAAVEAGVSYIYWGSLRRPSFGQGIRNLARRGLRDRMTIVIQSYSRLALLVRPSLEMALWRLGIDHADVLLLGWWNRRPRDGILDAALRLKERGLVRHIAFSTHNRPLAAELARDSPFDVVHVRYNAAHRGAEREVFPHLGRGAGGSVHPERGDRGASDEPKEPRAAGIVAFTATRWGTLLEAPRGLEPGARVPTAGDCYRFVLSNQAVDVCLSGPRHDEDLRHALAALEKGPMDEEELAWMRGFGDAVYGAQGGRRSFLERF